MSCLIDHTVYDTWNPLEDPAHVIESYWTCAATTTGSTLSITAPGRPATTDDARLTQQQFDRILQRVKALHRTASNSAPAVHDWERSGNHKDHRVEEGPDPSDRREVHKSQDG